MKKSNALLANAANRGHAGAMFLLGDNLIKQGKHNLQLAVPHFREAARRDNADAQFVLACIMMEGFDIRGMDETPVDLLIQAASQSHKPSRKKLTTTTWRSENDRERIKHLVAAPVDEAASAAHVLI